MTTLREFMANRRAEIQAQIKALRAEMTDIDNAERALNNGADPPKRERGATNTGRKTLKEMAIEVLREAPTGLDALAILARINAKFGVDIQRESLSPQLSRLGAEGTLVREGMIWRLGRASSLASTISQLIKAETLGAQTPSVSRLEGNIDDEIPF